MIFVSYYTLNKFRVTIASNPYHRRKKIIDGQINKERSDGIEMEWEWAIELISPRSNRGTLASNNVGPSTMNTYKKLFLIIIPTTLSSYFLPPNNFSTIPKRLIP